MLFEFLSVHSGFFGAVLGAVAGGAGAWGATKQWIRRKDQDDLKRDETIEEHRKQLEAIHITRKELMYKADCRNEQDDCHRVLCKKIEDLTNITRDTAMQTNSNAVGIATIQEHIRGLEKRYDDERQRNFAVHKRHESVL